MDPKPRQKSTDRKRDLAAAALRCLQREGYATLTARKTAAEAGMSPCPKRPKTSRRCPI